MVDSCKNFETFDHLCLTDPEESNDPFLLVPVTSSVTGITYKNYFCAVCNEEVDSNQLEFWDLEVRNINNGVLFKNLTEVQLKFNKAIEQWTVIAGENDEIPSIVPVTLQIRQNSKITVKKCPSKLIESCSSNWKDETVASKCREYMARVFDSQYRNEYRNPHCALCNFEILSNLRCATIAPAAFAPAVIVRTPLINLLVLEDRKKRCGRNMVYDKFADKCRCNSRIYRKENGKCVYKI